MYAVQQVKRWQGADHRLRWIGSALLFAESGWNRIHGYRYIPGLVAAMEHNYHIRLQHQQKLLANAANSHETQRRPRRKVLTDAMVAALPRRRDRYFHPDPELPKHGVRVSLDIDD